MTLEARELTDTDERAFFAGLERWESESLDWYTFSWKPGMAYADMMVLLRDEAAGRNLAPGRVRHTMLYGFFDGEIVGRVSIRHELNEFLRERGGNLGYAIAPSHRRRGHATELVCQGIGYCRALEMTRLLVTCAESNIPSWRIIERFGGMLQDTVWDDGHAEDIRRYWITL